MSYTKRIVLSLTSAEYEELYRAVRDYHEALRPTEYAGQHQAIEDLWEKMAENYDRNGCP